MEKVTKTLIQSAPIIFIFTTITVFTAQLVLEPKGIVENTETLIEIVRKTKDRLGLTIYGGSDTNVNTIVIQEVIRNGICHKDQRLRVGDHILECHWQLLRFHVQLIIRPSIISLSISLSLTLSLYLSLSLSLSLSLYHPVGGYVLPYDSVMYKVERNEHIFGTGGDARMEKQNKKRLLEFIKDLSNLLFYKCLPVMDSFNQRVKMTDDEKIVKITELEKELQVYQKDVIQLQKKVIQLQDKELSAAKAVAQTVEREMKSFSSVVSSNCAAAMAPSRLQAVIKRAAEPPKKEEEPDRSRNIIFYNVDEEDGEQDTPETAKVDQECAEEIVDILNEKFKLSDVKRIGVKSSGKTRPIVAKLSSRENVVTLLRKANELRESENFSDIYLSPDRTFEERAERKRTVEIFKKLKVDNPTKQYVIRRGVIECV
eukprot:sb/3464932/